jgi:signal transduction histidine kinase/ActR/RegA family two-component response regulator
MIPNKIQNTFIELIIDFNGKITALNSGNFCTKEFNINQSIYTTCPFLEGTLDALTKDEVFNIDGMIIESDNVEYNVEVELLMKQENVVVLIEDRTNVYQYIIQLNQNRNDIALVKEKIAKQNIELEKLRQIADKANEEKSRFLAVMSHEVRNPLNSILAYTDIILSETNNEEIKNYANSLHTSGKNLNVIVNDILDISRIEAGRLDLINEPISIKEVVEDCVKSFKIQYKESNVELFADFPKNLPEYVLGDAVRINQILSNLIKNAYKFTKKGQISIKIHVFSEKGKRCKINFKIEDSGRGMSKEQQNSIFNEYEQNEVTDFTISKGVGLGLSIVKRLVEAMQGFISVESQVGVGSAFSFGIPFLKTEKTVKKEQQIVKKDLSKLKVLFADDDILNQSIAKHFLQKEEVNVTIVNDGFEALEKLKTISFDLVLLDINMPNLTGEELVQRQKLFSIENKEIPLIAVTGNTANKDVKRYISIGFTAVLSKPYNAKSLISIIQNNIK